MSGTRAPPGTTRRIDLNAAVAGMDLIKQAQFWERVAHGEPEVCWPWKTGKMPKGYGVTAVNAKSVLAHRVAYILRVGPIPAGLIIRHRCHNPSCCNPSHLQSGTYADNEADKKLKADQGKLL